MIIITQPPEPPLEIPDPSTLLTRVHIDNGQDCSSPDNWLADATHQEHNLEIRNFGCRLYAEPYVCPAWRGPTDVCVTTGAVVAYTQRVATQRVFEFCGVPTGPFDVSGRVGVGESSTLEISGGRVGSVVASQASLVRVRGGTVEGLWARDYAQLEMSGGETRVVGVEGQATASISGGSVESNLIARDEAVITVLGSTFALDGVPVFSGPIASEGGSLSGWLSDGSHLEVRAWAGSDCANASADEEVCGSGTIVLVPEPDALSLAAAALAVLALRRWRELQERPIRSPTSRAC